VLTLGAISSHDYLSKSNPIGHEKREFGKKEKKKTHTHTNTHMKTSQYSILLQQQENTTTTTTTLVVTLLFT
jgi:hypothetical protein